MNKVLIPLLLASLPLAAVGQDRIQWTDGTATEGTVTDFTVFNIKFAVRAQRSERPSDQVVGLEVERVREAYRRGFSSNDPGQFLSTARQRLEDGDKFFAQFGFYYAATAFLAQGNQQEAFSTLDELKDKIPDSGFFPDCYRLKIDYFLDQGQAGARSAVALAQDYVAQIKSSAMPEGFALEGELYSALAQSVAGTLQPPALERTLRDLLVRVSGPYPATANRVRLWMGITQRTRGQADAAREVFQELIELDSVDQNTRARAYLNLGHLEFARGDANNKDAFRAALLSFLRVYMETRDASPEVVAEALHFAAESADRWGGADSSFMRVRLRRILDAEYANSSWAGR